MQKYYSQEGREWPEVEWYVGSKMPIIIQLVYPIRTPLGEFPGGEITELAANIIAELIYAQCDVNENEYLLIEVFVDHSKNGSALSVEDQKAVIKG